MKKILLLLLLTIPLFAFTQENAVPNIFKAKKTIMAEGLSKTQIYDILKNIDHISRTGKLVSSTPENMSVMLRYIWRWEKDPVGRTIPLCVIANCQISDGQVKVFLLNYHLEMHSTTSDNSPISNVSLEDKGADYFKPGQMEQIQSFKDLVFKEIQKTIDEQKDNYLE